MAAAARRTGAADRGAGRRGVGPGQWRWPLGEIDRPFEMRRDALVFDARSAAGNVVIHGGPKSGKSSALLTFIQSAAEMHSPAT